jgi:uncharacterized protein (DUF362 family)
LPAVSIVKGQDSTEASRKAISLLGGPDKFFNSEDQVLIKPNVCGGVAGKIGTFTNIDIVASIVSLLQGKVKRITVGEADSSMYLADRMLKETGIADCAGRLGIEVVNLSQGEMVDVLVQDGCAFDSIKVSRTVSSSKIVSVPVAKTHATTEVTLNLKNMFGVLPLRKKGNFHSKIDPILVDITKTFPPTLCVIDATTGLEGLGPFHGDPVKLDLLVAGDNAVATDAVMASIMGFDPKKIAHLRLASEKGLGPINLEEIRIVGESVRDVKRKFRKSRKDPFARTLGRIPGVGHFLVHETYVSAVRSWKRKAAAQEA